MNFRIRQIHNNFLPSNKKAINEIIAITRDQISDLTEEYFDEIKQLFQNPFSMNMKYFFFTAEDRTGVIKGFAQISHAMDLNYIFLDLLATKAGTKGGGIGSALYQRVREEAFNLQSKGIFFECMTDSKTDFDDRKVLRQNKKRMHFYEQFGVYPIVNSAYEELTRNRYNNPYFIMFDSLNSKRPLAFQQAKEIVRSILQRKLDPPAAKGEINKVLKSFNGDPVELRGPVYFKKGNIHQSIRIPRDKKISLIFNVKHEVHHVKDRGYVESPVRVNLIKKELNKTGLFREIPFKKYSDSYILSVHDKDFFMYFKRITMKLEPDKVLYPDVFPIRSAARPPKKLIARAGYYSIDIYSPISRNSFLAARNAVNCALTGAEKIINGEQVAYALVRPPGHHAGIDYFGGFCFFNSTAISAQYLSDYGRVAILDLDYHHGNGQQDIFYERDDVLTISIHGDPDFEYPHFSGYKNELGYSDGLGYNFNYPLKERITGVQYLKVLKKAVKNIQDFDPDFLVIALGLDTARGDPTGTWLLEPDDFKNNGFLLGRCSLPTLVIQEGGYNTTTLGANARNFFTGLWEGMYKNMAVQKQDTRGQNN